MGSKAFSKNKKNFMVSEEGCQYRICQDAVLVLL
jgi:hypothetical protein